MTESSPEDSNRSKTAFESAKPPGPPSLFREFIQFIVENKAWWLVPILIVLGLIGLLVALAPTGATPFIYTLF